MNTNQHDLTTGVVWKRLLVFFLPIAAGTCIQQLYNTVDGLILGKFVGTVALAAVGGSAAQIINLLIGFFTAVTGGACVIIAQIYGAGRTSDVQRASANAIAVSLITGIALAVFGILAAKWMLEILQTPADTLPDAITYLTIYFLGVPFILVLNMESNMLRAVGDSFNPFLYMVIACLTNIVLDFTFVVFLHWGVAGVAAATVAAQLVNTTLLTWKLCTTKEDYRLNLKELRLKGKFLPNMLRIGIPSGLQASMYSVSNMVIQVGVNTLMTVVVASWAMTSKVDGIYWAVINAFGTSVTTFIGQNIGAGRVDRAKECVKQGLILAMIITIVLSSGIMLAAKPVLAVLTDDEGVISTTYVMLTYFVPYYFTWVFIEIFSAVLRGAGDAVNPVIIIGIGVCLLRVIWIVTLFSYFHTLAVLCLCYPVTWVVTGIALLIYYRKSNAFEKAARRMIEK